MELYNPRKLKFKAWNVETKLLMRLNSIDCVKGELYKKAHILLQFTGLTDKHGDEVYDMDILLKDNIKYLVCWDEQKYVWRIEALDSKAQQNNIREFTEGSARLRSYFESSS
jgi:hypothetical protein